MDFQLRPDRDLTVLIPARAGSKRVPNKNIRFLGGKPLLQWAIDAALAANVAKIVVSTDDPVALQHVMAPSRNDHVRIHPRKPEHATDDAPDILWVLDVLPMVGTPYVAICRPTSPFRTASTIRRGFAQLVHSGADSIRAVEKVSYPHPAKMWQIERGLIQPLMRGSHVIEHEIAVPWHSMPSQQLPTVYRQNASLEIARVEAIKATKTISGYRIAPFFTEALESFDINEPEDLEEAERILAEQCYGYGV